MTTVELRTPLREGRIRSLVIGDGIVLSGTLFAMRDQASLRVLRILRQGGQMPVGLEEGAIFHAGPAIKRTAGGIRVISIGPTTSARMNPVMPELIDRLSLRCVIGKGGMDDGVSAQMAKTGCMYASALGGCAPLYTRAVKSVRRIVWDEMGPEALYELHVEAMGPLVVTMDAHGESLHRQVRLEAEARLKALLETSRSRRGQI